LGKDLVSLVEGVYEKEVRRPHYCRLPEIIPDGKLLTDLSETLPGIGSIWRCKCGLRWELKPAAFMPRDQIGEWWRLPEAEEIAG
jgi:hypothetical protein